MNMTNLFNFTATEFINYVIEVERDLAHMRKGIRDFVIEYAENEFKRANPREHREYCLMIIRAFTPCN